MVKVVFDFDHIPDCSAFYAKFARTFALSDDFGANLDALWDMLTGGIGLPVEIEFIHLDRQRKKRFSSIVRLFAEAEEELPGSLYFNIV